MKHEPSEDHGHMRYDETGEAVAPRGYVEPGIVPPEERGERFAALIRNARRAAGISQEALATKTGVSRSQLIRWEAGKAERPDAHMVREVCLALKIDPREAAIALGYLTRDEAFNNQPRLLDPLVEEVLAALEDPHLSPEDKQAWIDYLKFLHTRAANRSAQTPAMRTSTKLNSPVTTSATPMPRSTVRDSRTRSAAVKAAEARVRAEIAATRRIEREAREAHKAAIRARDEYRAALRVAQTMRTARTAASGRYVAKKAPSGMTSVRKSNTVRAARESPPAE